MRVERVITNETCNQNCWFCSARRPAERPELVARAAVRERIARARAAGAQEIVLTGGEPTLRSDVADLVRRAAQDGSRVVLETNAALVDEARARALAAAGLHTARVQLVAWGQAADEITRDPGGFAAAVAGIRALTGAGIAVEVSMPVVRRNLDLLAAVPGEIAANALDVASLLLVVPTAAPRPRECATLGEIAACVEAVAAAARRVGLAVRLDAATFVPPCIFEKGERVAHLYALNRGNASRPGFEKIGACASCLVDDRCPGLPQAALRDGGPGAGSIERLHPVRGDRLRRRLTIVSSVEEQVARELFNRDEPRNEAGERVPEYTIRVNFHCNQSCEFCFVSTHLPPPAETAVREAIASAGRENAVVILSGGEPTLNPRLADYVRLAVREGARSVELQSNAIRLGDAALAASLVEAGLDRAMISLHGSTAAISDAVTGAPGTYASTVRGLDELARTPIQVRINFVFCETNRDDFPPFVDLVAARWPRAMIVFSFVGSHTDVVPRTTSLIPRFSDIMPSLCEGLARARAAGLTVLGFDSMCGLPVCLVPEAERGRFAQAAGGAGDDGGGEFVKGDECVGCGAADRCYGVRRGYAELYGTSELRRLPPVLAESALA
jgi:MoaA/NifB/PqqE/SkfB family radical SAM enzyme